MRLTPLPVIFVASLLACACSVDDRVLLTSELSASIPTPGDSGDDSARDAASQDAGTDDATATPRDDCPDLDQDGIPDCQQSLVRNPTFDGGDTAWVADDNVTQTWSTLDANELATSGSMKLESTLVAAVDGLAVAGARQCLTVGADPSYALYAQLFVPSAQQSGGSAGLDVTFYASPDCTGAILDERGSDTAGVTNSWQLIRLQAQAPQGAHTVSVRLITVRAFAAAPFGAVFDNVLVRHPAQGPRGNN